MTKRESRGWALIVVNIFASACFGQWIGNYFAGIFCFWFLVIIEIVFERS